MVQAMGSYRQNDPQESLLHNRIREIVQRYEAEIQRKQVRLEIDLEDNCHELYCSDSIYQALDGLFGHALARCPENTELTVSAYYSGRGPEVEIGDEGPDPGLKSYGAFIAQPLKHLPPDALQTISRPVPPDAELFCSRCPQGGLAWTLVLQRTVSVAKVA